MNRSGNPLLDWKLEEFTNEMIKTMIAHKHKHNIQNDLTCHNNTPIESLDIISLLDHLNSEMLECKKLYIDEKHINGIELKKELLDLSNMCFFIYWYLDQLEQGEFKHED